MTFSKHYTLVLAFISCIGQVSISAQTPIDQALKSADTRPNLPGCDPKMLDDCTKTKLTAFINANLKTPAEAAAQGAGGVVMVEFVVEKNGKIGEAKTLHDPGFGLGNEAIRVVKLMNEKKIVWIPATDKGKKVPFRFITPVSFNMSAAPKEKTMQPVEVTSVPKVYEVVDEMPRFAGCNQTGVDTLDCTFKLMLKHIQTNLKYPKEALANKIQGPVEVDFVIDSSGHITDPVVTKGLGSGCDEEALRVINMMPAWTPGKQGGKPVAVKMTVPILFQLPKEKN